ncbi:MAG: hypothetical protein ACI9E1_001251, partial [Cryomorphaceae bacterium]
MTLSLIQKKLTSTLLVLLACAVTCSSSSQAAETLPHSVTFIGQNKFQQITQKAITGNWRALAMGDR